MSRAPRILPVIAVVAGGVLAMKALAGIEGAPDLLAGARAWAEEAEPGAAKARTPEDAIEIAAAAARPPPGLGGPAAPKAAAGAAPAPVPAACAPSAVQLAKDAGLSPAELQVLQSLGVRRQQLDQREQDLDTQLQLLAAAETKLDGRLRAMEGLKAQIEALLGKVQEDEQAEVDRLVTVYSKMKPREAAAIMTQLDDKVRIPVAARMKEAGLAAILAQMPAAEAKKLTERLASRYEEARAQAQALAPAAASPTAPAAAAPAPPRPAPARPAQARPAAG